MIHNLVGLIFIYFMHKSIIKLTDFCIEKTIDITSTQFINVASNIKNKTIQYMKKENEEEKKD
jgi:hypothetical protein